MSTAVLAGFLAIETCLQLLDRGARQHQSLMLQNVVDVRADRREEVDLPEVGRSVGEADVQRVPVDDEGILAEAPLAELFGERLGLRSEEHTSELQSLMRISYAVFCLKKKHN